MKEIFFVTSVLFFAILLFIIIDFIKGRNKLYLGATISTLVLYSLLFAAVLLGLKIPYFVLCLVMLSLFIHVFFGYRLDLYNKSPVFDRFLHGFGTFCYSLLFYFLLDNFIEYGGSRIFHAVYISVLGIALGAVYEIIEFVIDIKKNINLQRGLKDTNMDTVFNIIGAFSAAALAYFAILE